MKVPDITINLYFMLNGFVPEGARSAPPVYIYCIHSTTQTGSLSRRSVTAHLPDTTETA